MALNDCIEAIMFLWRLNGSTMHRETAKSRTIRKLPDTWKRDLHKELEHRGYTKHPTKSENSNAVNFSTVRNNAKPGSISNVKFYFRTYLKI